MTKFIPLIVLSLFLVGCSTSGKFAGFKLSAFGISAQVDVAEWDAKPTTQPANP